MFAKLCQDNKMSIMLGKRLKKLREGKGLPQRSIAAILEIDTATYCKIEKGERYAKKEQVLKLSRYLNFDEKELLKLWSADKVYKIIINEENPIEILNLVAEKMDSFKHTNSTL